MIISFDTMAESFYSFGVPVGLTNNIIGTPGPVYRNSEKEFGIVVLKRRNTCSKVIEVDKDAKMLTGCTIKFRG